MTATLIVLALSLVGGLIYWGRKKRLDTLERLAAYLDGRVGLDDSSVRGTRGGLSMELRFVTEGSGSSAEQWTVLEATGGPQGVDFKIDPRSVGRRLLAAHGLAVLVETGDAPFDSAFQVEGAPADLVRRALGPEVRAAVAGARRPSVEFLAGRITLRTDVWLMGEGDAEGFIDLAVTVAKGADAASRQARAAGPAGPGARSAMTHAEERVALAAVRARRAGVFRGLVAGGVAVAIAVVVGGQLLECGVR